MQTRSTDPPRPDLRHGCDDGATGPSDRAERISRPRSRWTRRALLGAFGVSLLANGALWAARDTDPTGSWRDRGSRDAYHRAYRTVLEAMPRVEEERFVPTSFGTAHAVRFGSGEGTPLLLLPGWGAGIPQWSQNLPDLIERRTVWALDAVGDAGLSAQDTPFADTADEARWVSDAIGALGVEQVHLMGHSFGARIGAEVALRHADQVETLVLLEPVLTFSTFPLQMYFWSIPASLPFLPQSWQDAALEHIGGSEEVDRSDPQAAVIAAGTAGYSSARPLPPRLSDDELRSWRMPVFTALGGASSMHDDPHAAEEKARQLLDRGTVEFWPEGTHSLPMDDPARIDAAALSFLEGQGADA